MKNSQKALIQIIIAAILGGGIGVMGKIALREVSPIVFTIFRFLFAGLILTPIFLKKEKFKGQNWKQIFLVSLLCTGNVVLYATGVRLTSATASQVMYGIVPAYTVLLSYFILKQKFNSSKILGVVLGFIGVLVLIYNPNFIAEIKEQSSLTGNLIVLGAVTCFSFYSIFSKKIQGTVSPITLTFALAVTTVFSLSILGFNELIKFNISEISTITILATAYVGIFGTAAYYLLYQNAVKNSSPLIASLMLYIQPITTYFWALIFLGEKLSLQLVIGGLVILIGAWMIKR